MKNSTLIIKVPEASRVSGISENTIRQLLRLGCDWGQAVRKKGKTGSGNPSFIYLIFREKFTEWLGIAEWPEGDEKDG